MTVPFADFNEFSRSDEASEAHYREIFQFMGMKPWHIAEIMATELLQSDKGTDRIQMALKRLNYWSADRGLSEYKLAAQVIRRRTSVCILIGGTSGSGKSTLASLLASRIGITNVISTDHIRQLLRSQLSREQAPYLWSSSYQLSTVDPNNREQTDYSAAAVFGGYERQTEYVLPQLLHLVRSFGERKETFIIEGVHLSVKIMQALMQAHPQCIPFLLYISNQSKHTERFAIRAKYMTLESRKNRYIKHFNNIRIIQETLCKQADDAKIPKIDNTNIDRSLAFMHKTVFEFLYQCSRSSVEKSVEKRSELLQHTFSQMLLKYRWTSKDMLQYIREKQQSKPDHNFPEDIKAEREEEIFSDGGIDDVDHEKILMCLESLHWGSLGS